MVFECFKEEQPLKQLIVDEKWCSGLHISAMD